MLQAKEFCLSYDAEDLVTLLKRCSHIVIEDACSRDYNLVYRLCISHVLLHAILKCENTQSCRSRVQTLK